MTTLSKKHLSYLKRYADAGKDGTCQIWMSDAIPELYKAGYLEKHQRRVTIYPTRITAAGLKALADAARGA